MCLAQAVAESECMQVASEGSRDERRRPAVALVDRQLFERILLSFDTMPHHLPDTYLSAVQQL